MEGAVHTTSEGKPQAWASTLQQSLITPLPTANMPSQRGSKPMVRLPIAHSSGSMRLSPGRRYKVYGMPAACSTCSTLCPAASYVWASATTKGRCTCVAARASGSASTAPFPTRSIFNPQRCTRPQEHACPCGFSSSSSVISHKCFIRIAPFRPSVSGSFFVQLEAAAITAFPSWSYPAASLPGE